MALSGASQNRNTFLRAATNLPVPHFASFQWEIETFRRLMAKPKSPGITSDDVFMMVHVGGNDFLIAVLTVLGGGISNVPAFLLNSVLTMISSLQSNIQSLYDLGMRRLLHYRRPIVTSDVPLVQKLEVLAPGIFAGLAAPLDSMMNSYLTNFLQVTAPSLWPDLEITDRNLGDVISWFTSNPGRHGIHNPAIGLYPNMQTQVGTGAWPVSSLYPTRNAYNFLYGDDVQFTQHTHRLIADGMLSWLSPLRPMVRTSMQRNLVETGPRHDDEDTKKKVKVTAASGQQVYDMFGSGIDLDYAAKFSQTFDFSEVERLANNA